MSEYFVVEPCTTANGIEIKLKERRLDLKKTEEALSEIGEIVASGPVVLLVRIKKYQISIYGSGRMMVKGADRLEAKKIEVLARLILEKLESRGALI